MDHVDLGLARLIYNHLWRCITGDKGATGHEKRATVCFTLLFRSSWNIVHVDSEGLKKAHTICPGWFELPLKRREPRWLSGRALDSGARVPGFEPHDCRIVSLSKTLY